MITSAEVRFKPTPPARVLNRKRKGGLFLVVEGEEKEWMAWKRSWPRMEPSRRSYE